MTVGLRKTVYQLLVSQPTLTTLLPAERWYERGGVVDSPIKPFAVLVWLNTEAMQGGRYGYPLEVWVHDERGDYSRIENILNEVRLILKATTHYTGSTGARLVQADYRGLSADLDDPDRGTNVKHNDWILIGA